MVDQALMSPPSTAPDGVSAPQSGAMSGYVWYMVGALTFVNIVASIDRYLMAVAIIPLKGAMALTDTQLGILYGLGFAILYCVAGLPAGRMADSMNRRTMMIVGCVLWVSATVACAFASTYGHLLGTRLIVGMAEAMLIPAAVSMLGGAVPRDMLGRANGIFFSGVTIGKAFAFIGGGVALAMVGARGGVTLLGHGFAPWQVLFLLTAIPGAAAIMMLFTIAEPPRAPRAALLPKSDYRALFRHIRANGRAYALFLTAGTSVNLIGHTLAAWVPSFYARAFDMPASQAAIIVGVISVFAGIVGGLLGGAITDNLQRRGIAGPPAISIILAVCLMIPGGIVAFILAPSVTLSVIGYACVHLAVLGSVPQAWVGVQMLTPPALRGMMSALFLAITSVVSVGIGPLVIGITSDGIFADSGNPLGLSLMACMGLFGIVAVITGWGSRAPLSMTFAAQDEH